MRGSRQSVRVAAGRMEQPLAEASGPHVWRGAELAADPLRWSHTLSGAELDALGAAADAVAGRDLAGVARADLPLSVRKAARSEPLLRVLRARSSMKRGSSLQGRRHC